MKDRLFDQNEMPKIYDPQATERRIYDWWEAQGYFKPRLDGGQKPFVISMPPPNVTGGLHLGHAITASIEDLMIRYHRMLGRPTLWVPGSDHAGIATQNVVERELAKEGLTRHDLGREAFVARVWQWKEKYGGIITNQHRRLGVSCDWERERFTLDEGLSRAVREAFVRLYDKGLIYRGSYLVNWCPRCGTAISDLEVEHEDESGKLWYVRYPLLPRGQEDVSALGGAWGSGQWAAAATEFIEVATTRPETILGDTAVAVNPSDARYAGLVGRKALLPGVNRVIPVIADEAVDPAFGTGAVKVTPAHDPTDYEIGQRHGLAMIDVMTDEGMMSAAAGPYAGEDRYACRRHILQDLEREGLLLKVVDHVHAIGHCQRCGTIVEPRISTQWFVKIKPLAVPAIAAVREGRIRIVPERFDKVYYNWMENIRDWCISRQLWWGHRIPVWYCDDCGAEMAAVTDPSRCLKCGSTHIRQDEDVLDTWFSSGLWPFSTLGWPEETPDLRTFYPTSVMETGYDILFFWVARMIMLGLEMTGVEPFHTVYLHGLIRDEQGRKMSKSLGNAIDPLEVMDQYGTDALRFTLLTGSTPGNDMKLALSRVEANRNFANKIWNAARFVVGNLEPSRAPESGDWGESSLTLADRWIISRQHELTSEVTQLITDCQFGEAGRRLYDFLWAEYCDWYIEISKIRLYGEDAAAQELAKRVLVYVLERTLRLLHPFMPFVTEEIWQHLPHVGEALIVAPWPGAGPVDQDAESQMSLLMEIIRAIRNARAEYDVEPSRRIAAIVVAGAQKSLLESQRDLLASLARVEPEQLTIVERLEEKPARALALVIGSIEIYLPLAGMVDLEAEQQRLQNALEKTGGEIARVDKLLSNDRFVAKAPPEVVERERSKLAHYREQETRLQERLRMLRG